MNERIERRLAENRERIEKGGYVPITPLGPPPQGEPLLATQGQVLTAPATPGSQPQRQGRPTSETRNHQGSQPS